LSTPAMARRPRLVIRMAESRRAMTGSTTATDI
jgi:hypothetical protein